MSNETTKTYRCGTLSYTKMGLIALFGWMLWGDFCYTIMELVVPSLVPLKLKSLECPNWVMGLILTTVPNVLNMTVTPYISVKSDRCRSRWGRRIPFILTTLPFLCLNLVLLGWGVEIADWLREGIPFLQQWAPATVAIVAIGIFMIMFQFFNLFVNTLFGCLFNDVVPAEHLGKFAGLFRVVGTAAGALYNWFAFKYAATHMHEIFLCASILYLVGFGVMCFMVREGQYPPVEECGVKRVGGIYNIKNYFRESFSHSFYWFTFISAGMGAMAAASWGFTTFFYMEMQMTFAQIGHYNAITGVISVGAVLFAAYFVDRWHPLRVYAYIGIFTIIGTGMNWIWVFISLPGSYFYWLSLASSLLYVFMNALVSAAAMPMTMRIYPHSRYGQFNSARGLITAFCAIISGLIFGAYLDFIRLYAAGNFCYRFNFTWSTTCCLINVIVCVWGYRVWNKMGGDKAFNPPAPWSEKGYEEVPKVESTGLHPCYLKMGLHILDALMVMSLVLPIALLPFFRFYQMMQAVTWFMHWVIPLSVGVLVIWFCVAGAIRRDIGRARRGEPMHNGLPHHGLMVVIGIKFGLALLLWGGQLLVAISLKNDFYAFIFGLGNIVTNIMICIGLAVLARIERNVTPEIHDDFDMTAGQKWTLAGSFAGVLILLGCLGVVGCRYFLGDVETNRLRNAESEQEILDSFRDHIDWETTAGAQLRLCRIYLADGRLDAAEAMLARVAEQMKANPVPPVLSVRYDLEQALLLEQRGRREEARQIWCKVADMESEDNAVLPLQVEAAARAGMMAETLNKTEDAVRYWKRAVKLQSGMTIYDNEWTTTAKERLKKLPSGN